MIIQTARMVGHAQVEACAYVNLVLQEPFVIDAHINNYYTLLFLQYYIFLNCWFSSNCMSHHGRPIYLNLMTPFCMNVITNEIEMQRMHVSHDAINNNYFTVQYQRGR